MQVLGDAREDDRAFRTTGQVRKLKANSYPKSKLSHVLHAIKSGATISLPSLVSYHVLLAPPVSFFFSLQLHRYDRVR